MGDTPSPHLALLRFSGELGTKARPTLGAAVGVSGGFWVWRGIEARDDGCTQETHFESAQTEAPHAL